MVVETQFMTKKIRIIGKRQERIVNIGRKQPRVDPEEVRKALGAEKMKPEEAAEWQRKHGPPAL